MNLLIKLTEIFSLPGEYDPSRRNVKHEHALRELYVNPNHIVYAKEDSNYINRRNDGSAAGAELVSGLDKNVSFTRLFLNTGDHGTTQVTVVGAPDQIVEKLSKVV